MSAKVDARGLSCPQPVLMALNEIKTGTANEIEILVDTETSKENVSRAATSQDWKVTDVSEEGGAYKITIRKD
ncbi:MAG: sulfurtransferase TusA family protein [Desulfuromonadales bacterium]|nr:sulfurtransferase TusA family protein [Desulfuromonadales bacterium]NOQ52026.1 preprotein translocase subunit TatB [Desulfuromonadaceae bacterium]